MTLREIFERLRASYCGPIGIEYNHIPDLDQQNFIRDNFENPRPKLPKDEQLLLFERLAFADGFEGFLANKYATSKRFGLEGA
eukprot:CAMPEP_0175982184 /NCGR_PEP_ID=MMETSP0108-20121206/47759_1 /TAXON_ID=195067 ORGANISM="Goniomonas pacifica, Strain CCMP1869" /NCGR_SAMPLE_ID=MMETSP0108 /ASSEMBLY_ACC=CAM_ASM_000204 /LENGTH=82 /DNA_ID=CAMNT_0017312815 /DNA_START=1 /DNA_END=245 /DNA_ORIENTATION=+